MPDWTRTRHVAPVVLALILAVALAGCGSDGDDRSGEATTAQESSAERRAQPEPRAKRGTLAAVKACAEEAGYTTEMRDATTLRVISDGFDGTAIATVDRSSSAAQARRDAKAADLVTSTVVGRLWAKYPGDLSEADAELKAGLDSCLLAGR